MLYLIILSLPITMCTVLSLCNDLALCMNVSMTCFTQWYATCLIAILLLLISCVLQTQVLPVSAFVAFGAEHSVANMLLIPLG
jgi:formate/nitrite transporter FocA (FNT family)